MRQHSVMSGALRRRLFIQIKKRIGSQSFCLLYSSDKKKYVADRAKYQVMKYQMASMSEDEP